MVILDLGNALAHALPPYPSFLPGRALPRPKHKPTPPASRSGCQPLTAKPRTPQEAAVRHALRFPALQRLAYSTCSVHLRENEAVVAAVLPDALAAGFDLVDPFPGGAWARRGLPGSLPGGREARVVRTDPCEDGTDGFFVAVFERRPVCSGWGGGGAEEGAGEAAEAGAGRGGGLEEEGEVAAERRPGGKKKTKKKAKAAGRGG